MRPIAALLLTAGGLAGVLWWRRPRASDGSSLVYLPSVPELDRVSQLDSILMQYGLKNAPAEYLPIFRDAENKNGIPPGLVVRQAQAESAFNPNAYNAGSGATGIMQIVPRWHPGVNPRDPAEAIPYGAKYLADLARQFGGSWQKALAAYNWGPGNLSKYLAGALPSWPLTTPWTAGLPRETREYVAKITKDVPVA